MASAPPAAQAPETMNWRTGLLRLWLVINLPLIAYYGYSLYSNRGCEAFWKGHVDYWYQAMIKHEESRDREKFDSAKAGFDDSVAGREQCRDEREFAVTALEVGPAGSAMVMLAGFWVLRGFQRIRST